MGYTQFCQSEKVNMLKALFYPDVPFDSLFIPHIYKEIYFERVYKDVLTHGMIIIDIGANIGIVTDYLRNYASKVYAIEPALEHFEALKKNKEYNKWDNVEIFNIAIADRDGEMNLNKYNENRTMYSLTDNYGQGSELVKTMPIDNFLDINNIENVDFIKLDVEGAEDLILKSKGFKKIASKVKSIEVEFHYPDWQGLVDYMIGLGYQSKKIIAEANIILFTR